MPVDIAAVPDELVERVVEEHVRRWSCDGCGYETYRITDPGSGTRRSCPECDGWIIAEFDPPLDSYQPSL